MNRAKVLALAGLSALSLWSAGGIAAHATASGPTTDLAQAIHQGQADKVDAATSTEVAESETETASEVDEQGDANEVAEAPEPAEPAEPAES